MDLLPKENSLVAIDTETTSADTNDPSFRVVGIGLCTSSGSLYFATDQLSPSDHKIVVSHLSTYQLIAHNVLFDASAMHLWSHGAKLNWKACTYGYYKQIARESYVGQKWGLKAAQVELLGWEETNDIELDEWLINNKYYKVSKTRADKSQMWRAPASILGKYCALDAEACWQLYHLFLDQVLLIPDFDPLKDFHENVFIPDTLLLVEQQLRGMQIDVKKLAVYQQHLVDEVARVEHEFLDMDDVAPFVAELEFSMYQEFMEKTPKSKKTQDMFRFNIRSKKQLQWLLFDCLGYTPVKETDKGEKSVDKKSLPSFGEHGRLLLEHSRINKELGYVNTCMQLATKNKEGTLHPKFISPGTVTGRLAGSGGFNLQQQSKSRGYLECFVARPGHKIVQFDVCLHPKTELLTKRGWIPVLDIMNTDEVWQVNKESLVGSWVIPSRIIRKHYDGKMFTYGNRRGKLSVTEGHTMLWAKQRNHATRKDKVPFRRVTKAEDLITTSDFHMITSTQSDRKLCVETEEIWKACMLQADGSITPYGKYVVEVSKPRKREKVRELLQRDGYTHEKPGLLAEGWYGIEFSSPLLEGKEFNLNGLSSKYADEFVEALSFWDGHKSKENRIYYGTTSLHNAEEVQKYLVTSGYEARMTKHYSSDSSKRKDYYTLSIKKTGDIRLRRDDVEISLYNGMVGCVTVPEGFIIVRSEGQTFVTGNCALEPCVLTAASRDPSMLKIYHPSQPKNDIYLFVAAHIRGLGDNILKYYNPDCPTKESIAEAKKNCKKDRSIAKVLTLSASYNAGPKTIRDTLSLSGVELSFEEVEDIHRDYWELFAGIKEFERDLKQEWFRNKGWVLDGTGLPITVCEDLTKDLVNRYAQQTGHNLLMVLIKNIMQLREERRVTMYPWISDFHDETMWEVPDACVDDAVKILNDAVDQLNKDLTTDILITGMPEVGTCLADFKVE